ncbi:metal ABC transporter ATP-binding protein [Labrys monachus]|uniref:Zinc/manganese transport system ATP-binding protein n=1 Tax=Labrys monachus TaxID=217067 RepID=A0ABU0FB27_9HYPH|nr:ABC transporter ATP-binding protein [Labrys monachus]MDQ0391245.1 zinc/manganese transport system ATP-binding protein [Labrys monachus]
MTAIAFEKVSLTFGKRRILSGVSFSIPEGLFVGVLGPNGAGKTTLMRAVLGLVTPQSGRIGVLGQPPRRGNPQIGYMPQMRRGAAQLGLSGFELVLGAVGGTRWGWPLTSKADKEAAWSALERVGAADLAKRPISQLSGGERQRVLIAQALIGEPKLLLLDEPLASLDPAHQRGVVELVQDIARERRISVLFCAHEINPLLRALDQVLYLGNGRAAIGAVDEVVNRHVLSDLYRTPIHVARINGRIFVMAEEGELESHRHDEDGAA